MTASSARLDARQSCWDILAIGLAGFAFMLGLLLWLDNVHINTTNGMWKSIFVESWKADFRSSRLDPSNYLYYPLVALLCRGLDLLGVHADQTWRQLGLISVGFAACALAIVYWLVRRLTGRRDLAAIAVLVHLGSAFFLALGVSNEDILPSYTLVLAAMAMAALWFSAPSVRQVVVVATVFTLGWLIEWRLMFPTLPPLMLALALSRGSLQRRAGLVALFLAAILGTALLTTLMWMGHPSAVDLPGLLWTGKGISSGWSGFSVDKLGLVVGGMGEYWWGGHVISALPLFCFGNPEATLAFAAEMIVLAAAVAFFWQRRHDARMRTVAVIFLGTLVAGEVMNAYSQPADPQMQINVMAWLPVVIALLLATCATPRLRIVVAALALVPIAYNVVAFSQYRGHDSRMEAALRQLEPMFDPARTVFVYAGWENMVNWQYLEWTRRWDGVCDLGPAPLAAPRFKWISLINYAVNQPSWTPAEHIAAVKAETDCAFDKGYRVVSGPFWAWSADQLADIMTSLGARDRAFALHAWLHATYDAKPLGGPDSEDGPGGYQELTRR
jgi:hypothetical protein